MSRVLWPFIFVAICSEMPARTMFLTAVRLKSCGILPESPLSRQALHTSRKSFICRPPLQKTNSPAGQCCKCSVHSCARMSIISGKSIEETAARTERETARIMTTREKLKLKEKLRLKKKEQYSYFAQFIGMAVTIFYSSNPLPL